MKPYKTMLKPYQNPIKTPLKPYYQSLVISAALTGPRKRVTIRQETFDFERVWAQSWAKPSPKYPARYPQTGTQRFRTILARFRCVSTTTRNYGNYEKAQAELTRPGKLTRPPQTL